MKKLIVFISLLVLSVSFLIASGTSKDTLLIGSEKELDSMVSELVSDFNTSVSEIFVSVQVYENGPDGIIAKPGDGLYILRSELLANEAINPQWSAIIGREVVVPIMSSKNPYRKEILENGIAPSEYLELATGNNLLWDHLISNPAAKENVKLLIQNNQNTIRLVQGFLGSKKRVQVVSVENICRSLSNDKFAIGFARLNDLVNSDGSGFIEGISIIPVDINENGKVDHFEDCYNSYTSFMRGVWIGKYPKTLYSKIFVTSAVAPVDENEIDFVRWILTEGQSNITGSGYTELLANEIGPAIQSLYATELPSTQNISDPFRRAVSVLLVITLLSVTIILVSIRIFSHKTSLVTIPGQGDRSILNAENILAPAGLMYDKSHTWTYMEMDGKVKVGVADFLQHVTGKITRVLLKKSGEKITKGDPVMTLVQDGKQLVIKSPLSGIIKQVNEIDTDSFAKSNSQIGSDWIYSVEPCSWQIEFKGYMMGDKYISWIKDEIARLKEFVVSALQKDNSSMHLVLQEGGELMDKVLENFGPEQWEDFQTTFLNKSI